MGNLDSMHILEFITLMPYKKSVKLIPGPQYGTLSDPAI